MGEPRLRQVVETRVWYVLAAEGPDGDAAAVERVASLIAPAADPPATLTVHAATDVEGVGEHHAPTIARGVELTSAERRMTTREWAERGAR